MPVFLPEVLGNLISGSREPGFPELIAVYMKRTFHIGMINLHMLILTYYHTCMSQQRSYIQHSFMLVRTQTICV